MARIYHLTISTRGYNPTQGAFQSFEMHFESAQEGEIIDVRNYLAKRCIDYFQKHLYYLTGHWFPKDKIRANFEREIPTSKIKETIGIDSRRIEYVGREFTAYPLKTRTIGYAKRIYKRRTS